MSPELEQVLRGPVVAEICRRYQVKELAVFGSQARGDARPDSDVDILVEFEPDAQIGFEFAGLMLDLQDALGRRVDLASKRGLKPRAKGMILSEARILYAV